MKVTPFFFLDATIAAVQEDDISTTLGRFMTVKFHPKNYHLAQKICVLCSVCHILRVVISVIIILVVG